MTEAAWDRHFAINTKGAFFTVQALDPLLAEGGSIVFTTVGNDVIFPGLSAQEREEFVRQGHESTPLRRTGTVEEVAAAALFLAADATFTTDVELAVDGGFAQGLPIPS
ncbi:hypothetical protein GCM10027089_49480 [Nocardia thraciensis]